MEGRNGFVRPTHFLANVRPAADLGKQSIASGIAVTVACDERRNMEFHIPSRHGDDQR